jgi:glycosyltransferase involved in cell wall biosynthesis
MSVPSSASSAAAPKILIIVENLTVPLDRRVWTEATALRDAGYTVSIICPVGGRYTASYERLDGIHIFRHPLPFEASGALGYAVEYSSALYWEFVLSVRVALTVGFDAIQACNPPDTIFLIAGFYKYLFGKPFVFDHHDINPELYEAKFGKRGFFHALLHRLERMTFRTCDVSIATNETFAAIARQRGGMAADRVFVVRSVPDLKKFQRTMPNPVLKRGRKTLVGYVGIMGAQDGVDLLVDAMAELVHGQGRDDIACAVVGSGTELEALKARASAKRLDDHITFTGFLSGQPLLSALSTFDLGVIPDPKNVYNDKISMNKVFEYMALGIPFVQFDLDEGRMAAADAALYARDNCPIDLSRKIALLADHADVRDRLRAAAAVRVAESPSWEQERASLLAAWDLALGSRRPVPAGVPGRTEATISMARNG